MTRKTNYNKIVDKELWGQVNEDNKKLLSKWLTYLKVSDKSPQTIYQYKNDMKIFFVFCLDNLDNKFFVELTKGDIIEFQGYLVGELELSSSRVRRLRSTLSSMSNYIESILDEKYPDFRNLISKIEAPKASAVREKTILRDDQVERCLEELIEKGLYQEACAFALASYSGSRLSEIVQFKINYFEDKNIKDFGSDAKFYITPEKIRCKGSGKKGTMLNRFILVDKFKPYFDLWIEERKNQDIDSEWLFVNYDSNNDQWEQLSSDSLSRYTPIYTKIIGEPIYFHCLRHYFVTLLSRNGIPHEIIQNIMGWKDIAMVGVYVDTTLEEKLENFFNDNEINFNL
ncbi:MAG: tyrosine-type recombinase/integrase [Clostridia bacterium]